MFQGKIRRYDRLVFCSEQIGRIAGERCEKRGQSKQACSAEP